MPAKHAFTNPKSDSGDTTIVRPVNWNANHTISSSLALGDLPPASPGTYDEEFEGTADTLPSNWSWAAAPSGSDSWTLNSRWPSLLFVEGTGNTTYTVTRTSFTAASTFGVWAKLHVGPYIAADSSGIRFYIFNSALTDGRGMDWRATGSRAAGVRGLRTITSSETVWGTELATLVAGGGTMYVGMTRDGSNNWLGWASRDGIAWDLIAGSQSHTFTVDRFRFAIRTTTGPTTSGVDWVRYRTDNAFPRP